MEGGEDRELWECRKGAGKPAWQGRWCEERGERSIWRGMEVQGILDGAQALSKEHGMKLGAIGVPVQGLMLLEMRVVT